MKIIYYIIILSTLILDCSCSKELLLKKRAQKYESKIVSVSNNIFKRSYKGGYFYPAIYDSIGLSDSEIRFLKKKLKCPFFEIAYSKTSFSPNDSVLIFHPKTFLSSKIHNLIVDMRKIPRDTIIPNGVLRGYTKISKNIHYARLYVIPMM